MMKILILGANGQLARNTTRVLLRDTDAKWTLYLRRASRLRNPDPAPYSPEVPGLWGEPVSITMRLNAQLER